jgi:hypothetical protein
VAGDPAILSRLVSPDQQVSLTDLDSRSMATSGRGSPQSGHSLIYVNVESFSMRRVHSRPMKTLWADSVMENVDATVLYGDVDQARSRSLTGAADGGRLSVEWLTHL